jgi:hypothetical protein
LGLVAVGSVTVVMSCQPQWRGEEFRATGLPLAVADVPGYQLHGTYADTGVIFLAYRNVDGQDMVLHASINRGSCTVDGRTHFDEPSYLDGLLPDARCFPLPSGHRLSVFRPTKIGNHGLRGAIPDGITIRSVSAVHLGSYPDRGTLTLPD